MRPIRLIQHLALEGDRRVGADDESIVGDAGGHRPYLEPGGLHDVNRRIGVGDAFLIHGGYLYLHRPLQ